MKLLLDTHIWLWAVGDRKRLTPRVLSELQNGDNEIWLSPISTWEALTLHRKGKVFLGQDLGRWLAQALSGNREAPLTHEIAAAAMQLQIHGDPADRFLVATAQVHELVLVTADEKLLGLGTIRALANR